MDLFYKEYGNRTAPLLVFLHGGGVSSWMWDEQVKYFKDAYHCVTIDLPGHGKNDCNMDFSINESAEYTVELIERFAEGRKVSAVGFSLGSQVLMQMLSNRPQLIDFAMINSVSVRPSKMMEMLISPMVKLSISLTKFKWFAKLQAKQLYISDEQFPQYYRETKKMTANTLVKILKENVSFAIPDGFSRVGSRILVTVGSREKGIMKKSFNDVLNFNEKCIGIEISGVGHGLPLKNPKLMNELIENGINDLSFSNHCIVINK